MIDKKDHFRFYTIVMNACKYARQVRFEYGA
jgi:hypothetical protein